MQPDANAGDGRNIDPRLGTLSGEAGQQGVPAERATSLGGEPFDVWRSTPTTTGADDTYFDRPVLKEPVWEWYIAAYLYAGGVAGAAGALGAAAQLLDPEGLARVVRRAHAIGLAGVSVGSVFLVKDLGRPSRFYNMLRVFRPTSPMNVGSWVLAVFGPAAGAAAVLPSRGPLGILKRAGGLGAGVAGVPLAGYTGVLVAATTVPAWHGARRALPPLFMASGVSGAASLLQLLDMDEREDKAVRRYGILGKTAELAAAAALDREVRVVEAVERPYKQGLSGQLWKASKALTGVSLLLSLVPGRSRRRNIASGVLGTLGSIAVRFAVFEAGRASARNPRATFHQQRAGFGAEAVTGTAAVTGPNGQRATR